MTAEIAIMNKSAIALAADSAVTIQHGKGFKIYNTHKLFNLCQSSPVGVMIYANADLMSVPWETIIKTYRKQLGDTRFGTLEEYGANFIAYLNGNHSFFPETIQDQIALQEVAGYLQKLAKEIDVRIEDLTNKGQKITEKAVEDVTRETIANWHDILKAQPLFPDMSATLSRDVLRKYRSHFSKLIADVFKGLPLAGQLTKKLRFVSTWLLTKDLSNTNLDPDYSGVVVAGFGESDLYPAVVTYRIESVVLNQLRYLRIPGKSERITAANPGVVIPFAQQEMIAGFMEGIDPSFRNRILEELSKVFNLYSDEVVKKMSGLGKTRKQALLAEMKKVGADLVGVFGQVIADHQREKHISPVVRAVSVLPKEELASMAEALVSLTSTKRRVTFDVETVGGPVDVAVISKGDGFIWIKRKHYFDADKNPQFFRKYR